MMSAVNTNSLMTPKKFSMNIEKKAKDSDTSYLDALLDYWEKKLC